MIWTWMCLQSYIHGGGPHHALLVLHEVWVNKVKKSDTAEILKKIVSGDQRQLGVKDWNFLTFSPKVVIKNF